MLLRITHETIYHYPVPVSDSYMEARLRPWSDADQGCAEYSLRVEPDARLSHVRTPFVWVEFFNVLAPHDQMRLVSEALVIAQPRNPFERIDLRSGDWQRMTDAAFRGRFWEYLNLPTEPEVAEAAWAMVAEVREQTKEGVAAFVVELARHIHDGFTYETGATTVTTPLLEVLEHRRGVCQDFSHLMLAVLRTVGIPARYVSGYLHVPESGAGRWALGAGSGRNCRSTEASLPTGSPSGAQSPEPRAQSCAEGAMHAWVEAFLPGSGWVGVDPTHGLLADHHYVKVGVGRCYEDVPPTRGVYRGRPEHTMTNRVRVSALAQGTDGRKGAYFAGSLRSQLSAVSRQPSARAES